MKISLSKSQWEFIGEKTGWIKKAGEDWEVSNSVIAIMGKVIDEINGRGGSAVKTNVNTITVEALPIDSTHSIPLKIQLYEGTYYPNKVLIEAKFNHKGKEFPIPVKDRTPFYAKEIVDAVIAGFMTIVNWKK